MSPTHYRRVEQPRPAGGARFARLLPLLSVFYCFLLLPPEVEFMAFGVNFPSYRIVLLAMILPCTWMIMRRRLGTPSAVDFLVGIASLWTLLSFTVIYGFAVGIVRGSGLVIDMALPYFVARASVKSFDDLRYLLLLCLPGLVFAGAFLIIESLSGRLLLRPAFASVFGSRSSYEAGVVAGAVDLTVERRLGLVRAYGPFAHPILAGIVMVGFLPLYYFSGLRSWPLWLGIGGALTGFFGLSSAAFLALILGVGAILIYQVKRYMPTLSWWTIVASALVIVSTLHVISKIGILHVISRMTLSPETAGTRMLIWEFGLQNVANNPWFGIGYNQWERPSWLGESVDAHFLLLGMRYGLVVPVSLFIAVIYGMVRLGIAAPRFSPRDRAFAIGINISMVMYFIVAQTVSYFGSSTLVFMITIAFVASMVSYADQVAAVGNQRLMMRPVAGPRQVSTRVPLPSPGASPITPTPRR